MPARQSAPAAAPGASSTPGVLVLVGRPNVGKSTLFNKLMGARSALVANVPGLTRDRQYGRTVLHGKPCLLVDTGGLAAGGAFAELIGRQADAALAEATGVLFVVDARAGLTAGDEAIADRLRRNGAPLVLVVNKVDGLDPDGVVAEFARLGCARMQLVSASQGRGLAALTGALADLLPAATPQQDSDHIGHKALAALSRRAAAPQEQNSDHIRTAVVGRPNVGKSTLINRLLGEERQIVHDHPGTTRDAVEIPFQAHGARFLLIDTAGVRRKGRVTGVVEKFSVVKSLDAMQRAHTVILVLDGREGVVDQDLHVLKLAADAGAGLVVAVNKWDALNAAQKRQRREVLARRLAFIPWAPLRCISALRGQGVARLMAEVQAVHAAGSFAVSTQALNLALQDLLAAHPPPAVRRRAIKLRYAHKLGAHPPQIAIHGNQAQALPASYQRYLENGFREAFNLVGCPLRLTLKTTANPYANKPNPLSPRQRRRRDRLVRHRKRR